MTGTGGETRPRDAGPSRHRGCSRGYAGPVTDPTARPARTSLGESAPVDPPHVPARGIALVGTAAWVVALVVSLLVPALHTGARSWWPWACLTGIALGVFAWGYIRRGRGNAAGA